MKSYNLYWKLHGVTGRNTVLSIAAHCLSQLAASIRQSRYNTDPRTTLLLNMVTISPSEMYANFYQTKRRHIPERRPLHTNQRKAPRHESVCGKRDIAPSILNVYIRWSITFRPLYHQGMSHWYPLNRELVGPWKGYGRARGDKNILHLRGIEPRFLGRPAPLTPHGASCYNSTIRFAQAKNAVW